ncbi:hypothetical protein PLESTM_000371500 [Pleodorina starrii]|nr:hypothetical protein PLESTM_000371500 [Pleodorina starrii]
MRQLKYHEQKLLKKVDFLRWKSDDNVRELQVMRRYHIQDRDDYKKYNKISGMITKLTNILKQLDPKDTARVELTDQLLEKCVRVVAGLEGWLRYPCCGPGGLATCPFPPPHMLRPYTPRLHNMGVIPTKKSLVQCDKLATAAFCRRRLSVVMVRLKMAETLREAVTFIEQGHVRVGPDTVTDPAFHVTRNMEDFVTWVDTSKVKRKVLKYNDKLDDYDLLM